MNIVVHAFWNLEYNTRDLADFCHHCFGNGPSDTHLTA